MKSLFRRNTILALALVPMLLAGCGESAPQESQGGSQSGGSVAVENNEASLPAEEQGSDESDAVDYPVIEVADYSGTELDTVENRQLSYSFPAGEWELVLDDPLGIAWEETLDSEQAVNINMSLVSTSKAPDNWIEDGLEQLQDESMGSFGVTVNSIEVRLLDGSPVIYMEVVTEFTDEMIDLVIEQGIYTEAQIEAAGGREALKSIPPTTQMAIYAEKDGYCYVCTGSYYAEDQRQLVLDTMAAMIGTVEKK